MSAARPLAGLAGVACRASRSSETAGLPRPAARRASPALRRRCQQPNWPQWSFPSSSSIAFATGSTARLTRSELARASRHFTSVPTAAESRTLSLESTDPDVIERRAQLLEEVKRMDEKRGEQVRLSFTTLNTRGEVTDPHLNMTKAEIVSRSGIHARDVRPLDSNNALSAGVYHGRQNLVATILPRRKQYIVLNLLYIRALILPQSVLIFDSAEGPESKLHKVIMNRLQRHLEEPSEEPFPFRVLESYLLSTASTLEAEVTLLRGQVQTLLSELEQEISRDSLKGLLSLGRDLTGLGERAGLVNDAVERCLNDDDVLIQFDLSGSNLGATDLGGMDDIELLLEAFSQRIEEVISEVQTTTSNVNSTQEIVELSLSTTRNALLVLDLKLSLISLGMGVGTFSAGLFGMNLTSGYEETPGAFYLVTGGLFALSAGLVVLGLRKLKTLRKVGLGPAARSRSGRGIEKGRWFNFRDAGAHTDGGAVL